MSYLKLLYKQLHVDPDIILSAVALSCLLSKLNPPQGGKVGRLSTVEALIEASMVPIGEGDDEVASLLYHLRSQQTAAGFIITLLSAPPQGKVQMH